jgi:DNA polymerase
MSRRESILQELGLGPIWKLRQRDSAAATETTAAQTGAALDSGVRRNDASGSVRRLPDPVTPVVPPAVAPGATERERQIAAMGWDELRASVAECRACALCKARQQAVLGVGDTAANWLFVGEGPGAEEDERGEPFVGQAGRLLDAMLAAIDLKRGSDVYIGNAVKCRPPNNRTPEPDEVAACRPYLQRQIALLRPKLIVALGRPAAQTLLGGEVKIAAVRGRLHQHDGIPLIVTYHPAYLLRNLADKSKSWEDLCFARRTMRALAG